MLIVKAILVAISLMGSLAAILGLSLILVLNISEWRYSKNTDDIIMIILALIIPVIMLRLTWLLIIAPV